MLFENKVTSVEIMQNFKTLFGTQRVNSMSTNTKLIKTQLTKIIQTGWFLGAF